MFLSRASLSLRSAFSRFSRYQFLDNSLAKSLLFSRHLAQYAALFSRLFSCHFLFLTLAFSLFAAYHFLERDFADSGLLEAVKALAALVHVLQCEFSPSFFLESRVKSDRSFSAPHFLHVFILDLYFKQVYIVATFLKRATYKNNFKKLLTTPLVCSKIRLQSIFI